MIVRTEKQILESMLRTAKENKLLDITDEYIQEVMEGYHSENQFILDLDTHAYVLSDIESEIQEAENNLNIDKAQGVYLDNLGELVGVPRAEGTPAIMTLTLSIVAESSNPVTVPQGTQVILDDLYSEYEFVTSNSVTVPAGVSSVRVNAESTSYEYIDKIPEGMAKSLRGYSQFSVTSTESTNGNDIESDDEYRARIRRWIERSVRGTRECISSYLDNYTGIDSYCLIPAMNGAGTLGIVCDTTSNLLSSIRDDVYNDCMLATDVKPIIRLPENTIIQKLKCYVTKDTTNTLTETEFTAKLQALIKVYLDGGTTTKGTITGGVKVGQNFSPSDLIMFLENEMTEIANIYLVDASGSSEQILTHIVEVGDMNLFSIDEVEVAFV